jgi:threonine/homoserine/homoserine lactone efflux protein
MEFTTLAAFALTAFAIVVSPGPDTILILRNSAVGNRRIGLFTVAGVQCGLIGHTFIAVAGLSLVISTLPFAFEVIAFFGAIYLRWLAVRIVRSGIVDVGDNVEASFSSSAGRGFVDAFLCNILNPKVLLIYFALMPNFVAREAGSVPLQLLVLGVVLIVINTIWQVPLSLLANTASRWLRKPNTRWIVSLAAGGILMIFAMAMVYEHIWPSIQQTGILSRAQVEKSEKHSLRNPLQIPRHGRNSWIIFVAA